MVEGIRGKLVGKLLFWWIRWHISDSFLHHSHESHMVSLIS